MAKYETAFKLKVVESFLIGEAAGVALVNEKVRPWVSHYRLHGIAGLQPKRSAYRGQFKLQVLLHQDREKCSIPQVAGTYDIRNFNQAVLWRRKLERNGVVAFDSCKLGQSCMTSTR